jgi:hypothetical protein
MDIVAFLSSQVPLYYALVPVIVLVVVLLTLIIKPSKGANVVVQSVPQSTQPATQQQSPVTAQQTTPFTSSQNTQTQPTSAVSGAVPPLSSWKPQEIAQPIPQEPVVLTDNTPQGVMTESPTETSITQPAESQVAEKTV